MEENPFPFVGKWFDRNIES